MSEEKARTITYSTRAGRGSGSVDVTLEDDEGRRFEFSFTTQGVIDMAHQLLEAAFLSREKSDG